MEGLRVAATGWRSKKQGIDTARVESLESLANIVPFVSSNIVRFLNVARFP